jgi:hypothetical protein
MAQNLLYILTEGTHDAAFVYRILKTNGFITNNEVIKNYPPPLNDFLSRDILSVSIPEVKIQEARSRFLPTYVMNNGENLILIYSIGGDSKAEIRISLIKALNALNEPDPDAIQAIPDTNISVLYFFDADNLGTAKRMSQVISECELAFPKVEFEEVYDPAEYHLFEDIKVGAYIFRNADSDDGMLEDVLLPLMRDGNEDIFLAAESFLAINHTCALFSASLTFDESGKISRVNGDKYCHKKSLVGTVGQLRKSGKSNTVCISDAEYITDVKINSNYICSEIISKIKKVLI